MYESVLRVHQKTERNVGENIQETTKKQRSVSVRTVDTRVVSFVVLCFFQMRITQELNGNQSINLIKHNSLLKITIWIWRCVKCWDFFKVNRSLGVVFVFLLQDPVSYLIVAGTAWENLIVHRTVLYEYSFGSVFPFTCLLTGLLPTATGQQNN